jgi:Arc/MetJ-type ribon-helix-helix transcriptional regulator
MKTISVNLPEAFVKSLENLVVRGLYANRSEAIRVAVRDLIKRELIESVPTGEGEDYLIFNQNITPVIHFLFENIISSTPGIGTALMRPLVSENQFPFSFFLRV